MIAKKNFILFFSLFILLLISSAGALSISLVETGALNQVRGTAFIGFDNTGTRLITIDNWHGANPNYATLYSLFPAYNVTNNIVMANYNLTSYYPASYGNWSLSSGYITRDGGHMYLLIANETGNHNDANIHNVNYSILGFNITNFDISTAVFTSELKLGVSTCANYVCPSYYSVFVSDGGSYLVIGGNHFTSGLYPFFSYYNMNNYDLSTAVYNLASVYSVSLSPASSFGSWANFAGTADTNIIGFLDRDIKQGIYYTYLAFRSGGTLTPVQMIADSTNREGMQIVQSGTNTYLFMGRVGLIEKYNINDVNVTAINANAQNSILASTIDSLLSLFPDAIDISFTQRLGYVFVVMLITTIVILFASSRIGEGLDRFAIWIVLIMLVVEFIYFVATGYIPIGVLVLISLIALAFTYLKFRNGGS